MCQSKEQGGRRCAAHLREPYQLAVNSVFRYNGTAKEVEVLNSLYAVAIEYAGTVEGAEKILRDIERNKENLELSVTLNKALKKARQNNIAETQVEAIVNNTKGAIAKTPIKNHLDSNGTAPEPISWNAGEPIWPNRETTADAVKDFHGTPEEKHFAMKAYRSLFKIQWHNLFLSADRKSFKSPKDNKEGWEWRRKATDIANNQITGARIINIAEVKIGMTVYNGFGIKTIKRITIQPETNWMDNGKVRKAEGFRFLYDEITPSVVIPAYANWVLLPNGKTL